MTQKILYSKPSITELKVEYVTDAIRNSRDDQCYAYTNRFEEQFAAPVGTQYVITTSSCTGVMHMGLTMLSIGTGDEVTLADTNWITTASSITHMGAVLVFIDILPDIWYLDPTLAEAAITPYAKAVIAIHLYDNLCEMDRLLDIGKHRGIPVIEDTIEAVGLHWHGHATGSQGILGTFSSHGTKTMTTGKGSMFVTNDRTLYDRVVALNNYGRVPGGKQFWSDLIDFRYHISNVQVAIGCVQLERIDTLVAHKHEVSAEYQVHLGGVAGLVLNPGVPDTLSSYWMPTVVFGGALGVTHDGLLAALSRRGIDACVFFYPLSQMGLSDDMLGNTLNNCAIAERVINLPSYHNMSSANAGTVSQVVLDLVQEHQKKQIYLAS